MRTKACHDLHVQNVSQGEIATHFVVTGECALSKALQHFHPITGFLPDILHNLLEAIVPVELTLCVREMILLKYFTLEYLNRQIVIQNNFAAKLCIGGIRHDNSTLLSSLPFLVGSEVPEGEAWAILMDIKLIVQLVLCPYLTEQSIECMQAKISDNRQGLQEVFLYFKL